MNYKKHIFFLILLLSSTPWLFAQTRMPANPRLMDKVKSGEVKPPVENRIPYIPRIPANLDYHTDIVYGHTSTSDLKLDVMTLKNYSGQTRPAIVYIHGGGWSAGSKNGIGSAFTKLAQLGYFCVSIDYRLSGEAVFPAQIDDCKTAIRWVRAHAKQYKVDTTHIGVYGGSAGGHLASLMGTSGDIKSLEGKGDWQGYSTKVQAVVDLFGPVDLVSIIQKIQAAQQRFQTPGRASQTSNHPAGAVPAMLGGPVEKQLEKARIASPVTYITPDDPPFLIIHGDEDKVVSIEQSRNFYSKLTSAGVEATLKIYPGEGHGIRNPESQDIIVEFFKQKLPIPPFN